MVFKSGRDFEQIINTTKTSAKREGKVGKKKEDRKKIKKCPSPMA